MKYNSKQLAELGAKGHALKNAKGGWSYPIDDSDDLDNAIKVVGRGTADHDTIRKYIIGRAKAMGEAEKIPDAWNADGSLKEESEEKSTPTNAQQRALPAGMTYNNMMAMLESAVADKFAKGDKYGLWVCDFNDEWLVYSEEGEKFQVPYSIDGDTVKLGKATGVKAQTSYSPMETKSARDRPTPEDYGVMVALKEAKLTIAHAKAKQLADPDYKSDPDDQAVMAAIEKADSAIDKAIVAQSQDGHEDQERSQAPVIVSPNWATAKRSFASLVERPPSHTITAEVRKGDSTLALFSGYPSTTGVPYAVRDWLGEYKETILPGAFAKTLREQGDVPLLFNHDGVPLASTGSGTSRLAEDGHGLLNDADLDCRDALTNSICVQLERQVLNKMSFSFRAVKDAWNELYDERGVNEAALYDTSIVTYPANPTTSAELVEAMRSAMGREGRSLWLAVDELSVRRAIATDPLVLLSEARRLDDVDDMLERALRALAHADEVVARSTGAHGRARTFLVAGAMLDLRAGKTLSSKNEGLLKQALDALGAADKAHQQMAQNHATAAEKVQGVLAASQSAAGGDGASNQAPPGNGNPISPQDGAGPRSVPPTVAHARRRVQRLRDR